MTVGCISFARVRVQPLVWKFPACTVTIGLVVKPACTVTIGLVVKPACTVTIGLVVKPVCTVAQRLSDTARLVTAQCVTIKFSNFAQATP